MMLDKVLLYGLHRSYTVDLVRTMLQLLRDVTVGC
jgi:hypothetical protein